MTIDIAELERLAKAAIRDMNAKTPEFVSAANPAAVLELVAEVERLRAIVDSVSAVNLMRLQAENERLRKIDTAARNLLDQRGRHNTEIAYRRLEAAVKGE